MVQSESTADLDFSMLMRAPNDLATLRNYYSQISMVDDGVGEIMASLEQLGIEEDTLLIFTTDHGLSVGQHGFWGHGGSSFPSNLHRAAHSIPMIVRQNGVSLKGESSQLMVSNMDLYSTILEHTGLPPHVDGEPLPSRSLMPVIKGVVPVDWGDDAVYSEQEETRVVRTQKWAFFKRFDGAGNRGIADELYDVELDPNETENLSGDSRFAETEAELASMLLEFFRQHVRREADLWSGGVPIQNSVRQKFWKGAWGEDWNPVYKYPK